MVFTGAVHTQAGFDIEHGRMVRAHDVAVLVSEKTALGIVELDGKMRAHVAVGKAAPVFPDQHDGDVLFNGVGYFEHPAVFVQLGLAAEKGFIAHGSRLPLG